MTKTIGILIIMFSINLNAQSLKNGDIILESGSKKLIVNQKYVCFNIGDTCKFNHNQIYNS